MTLFRTFLVLFFINFCIVAGSQLIHVFSIWRHGDRAPARLFSSPEAAAHPLFKNGLGNLTDQGIRHAHKMGEFWRKRYVENGFISSPEQIHIRSTSHARTQRTAKEAISALFPNENFELEVYPIDWMLKPSLMDCPVVHALQEAKCAGYVRFPSDYAKNFDSYEYDLWRCLRLNEQVKYFGSDKSSFRLMESILNEALNNYLFIGTNITDAHVEKARSMYRQVQRITLGIELYHEPDILRVYSGELLNDIITKIRSKIACRQQKTCDSIVFNGYSSQDLQIFPLLEILRSTKAAVGDDAPLYTSGLFVELYENGKEYFLKAFFRRDHTDFLVDLTPNLPGFDGAESCEFESFVSAVSNYSHKSNEKACQDLEKIEGRLREIEKWGTRNGVVLIDLIDLIQKTEAQSIENSSFISKSQNFLISVIAIILYFVIKI